MPRVQLQNTENRVQKISLTKLLQEDAGLPLDEAKYRTDALVDNGVVVVFFETDANAESFMEKATPLGVTCTVVRA